MSVRFEVKWEGVQGLKDYLAQTLPRAFKESIVEAYEQTAEDAKEKAKQLVSVDTGSLRRSIRKERHAWPAKNIVYTGIRAGGYIVNPKTGRLVDYARYIEYGTSRMRPRPFLGPALRWAVRRVPHYFWRALSKRVEVD